MTKLSLFRSETTIDDMPVRLVYDEEADILEIFFDENEAATGIELTDQILLRINRTTRRVVSLTLLDFSVLTEQTLYGPRSFPLSGIEALPLDLKETVLLALSLSPVNHFLSLTYFQRSATSHMPAVYVYPATVKMAA